MSKTAKSFFPALGIVALLFLAGMILQYVAFSPWLQLGILVVAAIPCYALRTQFRAVLTSYQFAISLLTSILIAVILGTFIVQNAPPEQSIQRYGNSFNLLHFFFFDQVFNSFWFNFFLAAMVVSVILVLIKRKPFRLTQAGFLLSHVGVILILAGGLIGRIFGTEGFIELTEGKSANHFHVMQNGNITERRENLKFDFKLTDFQVDYYNAKYKIYAYLFDPAVQDYRSVAAYDLVQSSSGKVPGTETIFEIGAIEKSKYLETGHNMTGRHFLSVQNQEPREIEIGKTYQIGTERSVQILEFFPHFAYDIEHKKALNVSEHPQNPALLISLEESNSNSQQWLFANMPDFHQMHSSTKKNREVNFVYSYELPAYGNKEVHLVTLLLKTKAGIVQEKLTYDPEKPLFLENGKVALLLDQREGEVKEYRSVASVIEQDREIVKANISVNHPLKYAGYSFYQSNYNPDDLTYSGFRVVKDPGLPVVYTGAATLCLGVIWIFYLTPAFIRARRRQQIIAAEEKNVTR